MPSPGFPYPLPDPFGPYCSAHTLILHPPGVTRLPQPCPWTRPSPPGLTRFSLSAARSAPSSQAPSPDRPPKLLPLGQAAVLPPPPALQSTPLPRPSFPALHARLPPVRPCSLILLLPSWSPALDAGPLLLSPLNLTLHPGSLCPLSAPGALPCLLSPLHRFSSSILRSGPFIPSVRSSVPCPRLRTPESRPPVPRASVPHPQALGSFSPQPCPRRSVP